MERTLDVFLNPRSLAVIGSSERPGSWGSFLMEGLLSRPYPGKIYPGSYHEAYNDLDYLRVMQDMAHWLERHL